MKKIICFALVLMALFAFVSCGDDYYETHGYSKKDYDEVYEHIKKGYWIYNQINIEGDIIINLWKKLLE